MIQEKAKSIIKQAVERGGTDLYLQGSLTHYDLYFRNLNSKVFTEELALETGLALIAHFKFCAGMNVGEKRRTQLGACWYQFGTESRRLRLSSVGDFEGNESLVIRFLHEPKEQLEFWFEAEKLFKQMNFRRGLYLFAGPVGSGKTSLMTNWANRAFDSGQVMTVEDPVEIVVSKFVQLQVNDLIGNDYEALIKLSLRHRPDLLIVGEIRDEKTARAVLRASLTGYTVFSTIHAPSISAVWTRLLEFGISEWELKSCLQAVVYQRLRNGKGMVEIAKEGFEHWSHEKWNWQIEELVTQGALDRDEGEREKIAPSQTGETHPTHGKSIE